MKTKKIKRVLAFFLAVVFAFSTCMTASPYTVQATEEPKLSVNVTNEATTETGPGLTNGIDLVINYGENQKKLMIGKDQLGNELSTDILYEEFSDASYSVSLSDRNNLYDITAEASVDAETKSLNITITELKVKTEGNKVFPEMNLAHGLTEGVSHYCFRSQNSIRSLFGPSIIKKATPFSQNGSSSIPFDNTLYPCSQIHA